MKEQLVVIWRIYEPCNLACPFCEYNRSIIRSRKIVSKDSILKFGRTLSDYQFATGKEVLVSWLGGEPLLWKELPSISRIYRNKLNIQLGLTTNGTSLDRDNVRSMLINDYSFLTISVDGFADSHDAQRGASGLFEKIKRYTSKLATECKSIDSRLTIRVNTILMQKNIYEFERFCMEIAEWGVAELTFNQLGGFETTEFYQANRILPEQVLWIEKELPHIKQKALAKGLKILGGEKYIERIMASSCNVSISVDNCYPGSQFLFINEANLASPCHFTTKEYGIHLNEIEDVQFLLKISERFRYKQIHYRALACDDCHSTQVFEKFSI